MDGPLIAGRYRRGPRLGAGGMASVWGARDERTGRDVAIKVLHPHLAGDDRQRARLQHEAAALSSIDDTHVVPVLDVIDDPDTPAIVMPRIDGQTLADRLERDGTIPETSALDVATAVAEALAAAHAVGVIHRDVKPSNILLGTDGVVRLMDFGIAADLDATTELTVEGVVGTLRYLAPERLLGDAATPATDVWGLGVVLIEMLTGHPAYPGSTLAERLDAASDPVDRPADVSTPTWDVIRRAADGDPGRRYPDGASLLAALRSLRGSAVVDPDSATELIPVPAATAPAAPAGPIPRPVAPSRQARLPAAVVAALAVGLLGAVGMAVVALDPGTGTSRASKAPASAPVEVAASAAPTVAASPAPTDVVPADAGGNGKGKGKGNGNGKGKGKDKP